MKVNSLAALVATTLLVASATSSPSEVSICHPDDPQCIQDLHVLNKRQVQQSFTPVTGATGTPVSRLNILQFQQNADAFNMFLWSLRVIQARVAETNDLSYYMLSGIHGRPYIPWQQQSSPSQDPSRGYCTHGSPLFGTWHRPYLALFEQRIVAHALNEAGKFSSSTDRTRWTNAARQIRLPYWDWATNDLRSTLPAILKQSRVTVTHPDSNGNSLREEIPNPLYQYTFRDRNLQNQYFTSIYRNVFATRRQPPNDMSSSRNALVDQVMSNTYDARRQNTYNLFSIPSFNQFSSNEFSSGSSPISWTSVESVHNEVHANVGGDLGHMSLLDYSAFDPVFWLHHCNVDRLVAMYQAAHDGRVVTPAPAVGTFNRRVGPNDRDTIDTPLYPFRKADQSWYTSRDVSAASSIWNLGYAYPEVPLSYRSRPASELQSFTISRVNALYGPSTAAANKLKKRQTEVGEKTTEWIAHIVFDPSEIPGSPECLVFLGNYSSNPLDRKVESNLVGTGASLTMAPGSSATMSHKPITATVPLTSALRQAGLEVTNVPGVVEYLKQHLTWTMQAGGNEIPINSVPSLLVGVSAANVTYGDDTQLPKYGEFSTYYEATEAKPRGFAPEDGKIVKSIDRPSVLRVRGGVRRSASDPSVNADAGQPDGQSIPSPLRRMRARGFPFTAGGIKY